MTAASIAQALGGHKSGGGWLCSCPVPSHGQGRGDRNPSLLVKQGDQTVLVTCLGGCDCRDVLNELRQRGLLEGRRPDQRAKSHVAGERRQAPRRPAIDDGSGKRTAALKVWGQTIPLNGALGERYFEEHRGLCIGDLKLHHALRWHDGIGAVVALMTDPLTNEPTGVHRTYLNQDGTKRERKMLGKQGVIRLSPDEDVTESLALVEGIEDGLAVLLSGWAPVWCATSAGAIERFSILGGIEALTIFADDDPPGMKAAHACVTRWSAAGCEARISSPKELRP